MVATSHNLDGTDLPLSDRLTNGRAECKRSWRDRMSRRGGDRLQRGLFSDNRADGSRSPLRWISRR